MSSISGSSCCSIGGYAMTHDEACLKAIQAGAITMEEAEILRELEALRQDRELCGMSFELVTTMRDGTEHRQRIEPCEIRHEPMLQATIVEFRAPSVFIRDRLTGENYQRPAGLSNLVQAGHKLGKRQMLQALADEFERDHVLAYWLTEEMASMKGGKDG